MTKRAIWFSTTCIFVAVMAASCYRTHNSYRNRLARAAALETMENLARATTQFSKDCGLDALRTNELPKVLYINPGILDWKGPYMRGSTIDKEAFGWYIKFVLRTNGFSVIAAKNGKFNSGDDLSVSGR